MLPTTTGQKTRDLVSEDFETFGKAEFLCAKSDASVVDPCIRIIDGTYYRFLKSRSNPFAVILEKGKDFSGPYERVAGFDGCMEGLTANEYEAPLLYQWETGNGAFCWTISERTGIIRDMFLSLRKISRRAYLKKHRNSFRSPTG